MQSTYSLRCSKCGAPLNPPKAGERFVKCEYCGYWNAVEESEDYTRKLFEEIKKWLSQLVPSAQAPQVMADPVARKHIFAAYVAPKVLPQLSYSKAKLLELLGSPIVDIRGLFASSPPGDPKALFEEAAKLASLSSLAIDAGDSATLNSAVAYSNALAYISNSLVNARQEKYVEAAKNLEEASVELERTGDPELALRMRTASKLYLALAEIANRNPQASLSILSGIDVKNPLDKSAANVIKGIALLSREWLSKGKDPLEPYVFIASYVATLKNIRSKLSPEEVSALVEASAKAVLSASGGGEVKVVGGAGDVLVPFYVGKVSLTFEKGGFLRKRGASEAFNTLVPATSPATQPYTIEEIMARYVKGKSAIEELSALVNKVYESIMSRAGGSCHGCRRLLLPTLSPQAAESLYEWSWRALRESLFKGITGVYVEIGELVLIPAVERGGKLVLFEGLFALEPRDHAVLAGIAVPVG